MAFVRYCAIIIASFSDETLYSAIIPTFELERVINHAENMYDTDCYMIVAPVLFRGKPVVFVDKMKFHHETHSL